AEAAAYGVVGRNSTAPPYLVLISYRTREKKRVQSLCGIIVLSLQKKPIRQKNQFVSMREVWSAHAKKGVDLHRMTAQMLIALELDRQHHESPLPRAEALVGLAYAAARRSPAVHRHRVRLAAVAAAAALRNVGPAPVPVAGTHPAHSRQLG